jgi:hypothetical protein
MYASVRVGGSYELEQKMIPAESCSTWHYGTHFVDESASRHQRHSVHTVMPTILVASCKCCRHSRTFQETLVRYV